MGILIDNSKAIAGAAKLAGDVGTAARKGAQTARKAAEDGSKAAANKGQAAVVKGVEKANSGLLKAAVAVQAVTPGSSSPSGWKKMSLQRGSTIENCEIA